ncbi:hypothetical protein NC652_017740 [Populus alba x Populus x berolinensis]|nr:hypothetical protein NC652_017740 [Populus alba x Populus x berolinensis]
MEISCGASVKEGSVFRSTVVKLSTALLRQPIIPACILTFTRREFHVSSLAAFKMQGEVTYLHESPSLTCSETSVLSLGPASEQTNKQAFAILGKLSVCAPPASSASTFHLKFPKNIDSHDQ